MKMKRAMLRKDHALLAPPKVPWPVSETPWKDPTRLSFVDPWGT